MRSTIKGRQGSSLNPVSALALRREELKYANTKRCGSVVHSLCGALFLSIEALNPIVARPKLLQRTGNVLKFSELTDFWAAWACVRFVFPFKQRSHSLDVNWRSQSGYILSLFLLNRLLSFAKIFVALQQQYRCLLKIFSENGLPIATLIKTVRNYLIWLVMDSPD